MLVMSQLPIQATKIFYSFFDVHLWKVPPPMRSIQYNSQIFVVVNRFYILTT